MDELLMKHQAIIALGANVGDGAHSFAEAIRLLQEDAGVVVRKSSLWRTEPIGLPPESDWFSNAVMSWSTHLGAMDLLSAMQRVEQLLGRPRDHGRNQPRTLDLDLVAFDDARIAQPGLTVPHPRMSERLFVLLPLAEVVPDYRLADGRSIDDAIAAAPRMVIERVADAF